MRDYTRSKAKGKTCNILLEYFAHRELSAALFAVIIALCAVIMGTLCQIYLFENDMAVKAGI